tara:strand:+ start:8941 stop:10152 length:1212 start_codon:yes stop_codon:yes gene_type:complete
MSDNNSNKGPLSGIRVLDVGTMIAGPVVGTLLADFGAEVIKVEQPGSGDPLRGVGPQVNGEGLYWHVENRNKKSVTANLRVPDGQKILRGLARHVDVVVENFRPGTMDRWNIGYDALATENPNLIMLSVSGFGQTGPYSQRRAYDRIALAMGGLLNITGYPDRPPVRPGTAMADYQSAILGAFSVMVAIYNRDAKGGTGQHIDLSLFESIFRFTDILATACDKVGMNRQRNGNMHFAAAPGDHFETSDGRFIVITVSANSVFESLASAMDRPDLPKDPRFSSHAMRWENIVEINGIVRDWIKNTPVDDVSARLDKFNVAYAFIYSAEDILADPHYAARQSMVEIETENAGSIKIQAPQPKFSATPAPPLKAAPSLGADTDSLLKSLLGMSEAELDGLRKAKII